MSTEFIITSNTSIKDVIALKKVTDTGSFQVYATENSFKRVKSTLIYIDGYVLSRFNKYEDFSHLKSHNLVHEVYSRYPKNWFTYLKGSFNIVLIDNNNLTVVNDHLGLRKSYFKNDDDNLVVSNNFWLCNPHKKYFDSEALAQKSIFNRIIDDSTIDKRIKVTPGGSLLKISNDDICRKKYWDPEVLLRQKIDDSLNIKYFANFLLKQVKQIKNQLNPKSYSITLTGGKDSRTALAALLNLNIKPFGFTYGVDHSNDAIYAKELARVALIEHKVFNPPNDKFWFQDVYNRILNFKHPWINVHRAHRLFAFEKTNEITGKDTAYFAGYLGGELLMGIYYDDLVFSKNLTNKWKGIEFDFKKIYENRFINANAINQDELQIKLKTIRSIISNYSLHEKEFFSIFEIGIPHHCQDLNLSNEYFDYSIPFFLDIDFLDALFKSKFNFKYNDNKTLNLFDRYKLYKFNIEIQHILSSNLDKVFFAKKGTYNSQEFRKGVFYWTFIKSYRYFFRKTINVSSYSYSYEFKTFIEEKLEVIFNDKESMIHKYYNLKQALDNVRKEGLIKSEKNWHRYTDIITIYEQLNRL